MTKFPVLKNRYFWAVIGVALLYLAIAVVIYVHFPEYARNLRSEGEIGENIAAFCWGLTAVCAFIKIIFFMDSQDNKWQWLWVMFAGVLAMTRELDTGNRLQDLQEVSLTLRNLGLGPDAVDLKNVLYFFMFGTGIAMFATIFVNLKKILLEFKLGNEMVTLMALGFVVMGLGFLCDGSSLGNSTIYPLLTKDLGKYIEEVFETTGALIFVMAILPYFCTRKTNLRAGY